MTEQHKADGNQVGGTTDKVLRTVHTCTWTHMLQLANRIINGKIVQITSAKPMFVHLMIQQNTSQIEVSSLDFYKTLRLCSLSTNALIYSTWYTRCFSNRRLLSRFRCGCHGLHAYVDTGRWLDTQREDRLCQICHSSKDVGDEQHFLFSRPSYSDVRPKYCPASMPVCFSRPSLFQSFSLTLNQMQVVVSLDSVFNVGNLLCRPDISFSATCVVFCLLAPST